MTTHVLLHLEPAHVLRGMAGFSQQDLVRGDHRDLALHASSLLTTWYPAAIESNDAAIGPRVGSGSCEKDSPVEIVAMKKKEQARLVHDFGLGKG